MRVRVNHADHVRNVEKIRAKLFSLLSFCNICNNEHPTFFVGVHCCMRKKGLHLTDVAGRFGDSS
jgi:hypothetical protein